MTVLDPVLVDLDGAPAAPPRRRPYRAALVAALIAGLVTGGAFAAGAHRPPPVAGARTLVTLRLQAIILGDRPSAVLAVSLQNLGSVPLVARTLTVSGAGLEPRTVTLARVLGPGAPEDVEVTGTLSCSRDRAAGAPVHAVVRTEPADAVRTPGSYPDGGPAAAGDVTALPLGAAATPGGVCSAADATLPDGWMEPAHLAAWSVDASDGLHLSVDQLAPDLTDVVSAEAGSVLLPLPAAPVPVRSGGAVLQLGVPVPQCAAVRSGTVVPTGLQLVVPTGLQLVVPTGLQLLVQGRDGLRYTYLPIGIPLADWLLRAVARTCPDGPGGPSAVRPESAA